MLAFVMVFTGMGIGSWGVDTAWAGSAADVEIILTDSERKNYNSFSIEAIGEQTVTYNDKQVNVGEVYVVDIPTTSSFKTLAVQASLGIENWYLEYSISSGPVSSSKSSFTFRVIKYAEKSQKVQLSGTTDRTDWSYAFISSQSTQDRTSSKYGILFRIGAADSLGPEKKEITADALKELCIAVQGKNAADYYTENDKYNGKLYSANGFWTDMNVALNNAKALFKDNDMEQGIQDGITPAQITAAYESLKKASDALIPNTQANASVLYEAMRDSEKFDSTFSYNAENLQTFNEKKTDAKNLLETLFNAGTATAANVPDKQKEIESLAAALRDSYRDDKMAAELHTQEELANFLTKAVSGMKGMLQNDITLTGYNSVSTFNGILDGNGHAVIVESGYKGLMGVNNGTIYNLALQGADLVSASAFCNQNRGMIERCHNAANFSNNSNRSNAQMGALCNINDTDGIIRNCYNTGKLSGSYVGGICGQNWGLIENCFNAGLIDAESNAGGIAWRNHNNTDKKDTLNAKSGTIRTCYNFNVMHHTMGWGGFYGSYMENNLSPICGDNEKKTINVQDGTNKITNEGTIENGKYLDTVVSNKPNGKPLTVALSDIYLAQKKDFESFGAGTYPGTAIAGWTETDAANSIFAYNTDYYVYYDHSNGHFIAVTFDNTADSTIIDAAKPSEQSELCKSAAGDEKTFYLVKVPTGTTTVQFKNTDTIIDYANGYTNRYLKAYLQLDHHGTTSGKEYSRKFVGTAIASSDVSTILSKVSAICGSDTATVAFVKEMLSGIEAQGSTVTPTEKDIKVKFRFVGATKSPSGNYDAKTNKDSQYVTWIATRTYSLKDGSSVGDLLKLAIKESGIKTVGEENNYVSGVYAPNVLGNYYLAEFTNGTRSGWMYTVNGKHPGVGLNGYYLKDGDSVIWHYINDYSYEVSDWFDDPDYPNLGNASTWDPWLKVPDVDPTKDTPTVGGAQTEEVKNVTTDTKTGTTTAPTEVKVSEKTNADGTKETVAEVKVDTAHHDEIIKQAAEKKSAEIILEVSAANTKGADSVQLSLDVTFVKNVADKTDADLTVNTENGKVTLDQETIKTVLAEAKGATITLEVSKVSKPTEAQKQAAGANGHLLKLTIKSGDRVISDFNKGKVKVVAEIVSKLLDEKVAAIHIADDGKIEQLAGKVLTIGGKKYYEFTTPHFSTFALVDADELGLDVAEEPTVDAKALTAKLTPVARSAKTAKKNVKVTVSLDKQDKAIIKELKDAGYTVKYRFYRSTKKAAGYKAAVTKKTASYTNTSGKKGTKYFYKVQVRVYDENGKFTAKTALKQCRYAARVWSK